ncbi:MAG TPA: hypothetical protein V6C58_13875, partial [Allocoleopsis sp.]
TISEIKMTIENQLHAPQKTYVPHGGNIRIDRDTLKKKLVEYKQHNENVNFDEQFIRNIEDQYNIRFVAITMPLDNKNNLKHDYMNVFAYAKNGAESKTETMHVEKVVKSKTMSKFSQSLFDYVLPRIKTNPETIEDALTKEAVKSLDNITKIKTLKAYDFMKQFYPTKKN